MSRSRRKRATDMESVSETVMQILEEEFEDSDTFESDATNVFERLKKRGKQYVEQSNFEKGLGKLKIKLDEEEVDVLVEEFDHRGKGVDPSKFVAHFADLLDDGSFAKKKKKKTKGRRHLSDTDEDEADKDELDVTVQEEIAGQVHMLYTSKEDAKRKMKKGFPSNSHGLTKTSDFQSRLEELGFDFSKQIMKAIAKHFQGSRRGYIDYKKFMNYTAAQYVKKVGRRGSMHGTDIDKFSKQLQSKIKNSVKTEKNLRKFYNKMDRRKKNKIDAKDLRKGLKAQYGIEVMDTEAKRLVQRIAMDDSGYISVQNFVSYFFGDADRESYGDSDDDESDSSQISKKVEKKVFKAFEDLHERKVLKEFKAKDSTGDGYIKSIKFMKILGRLMPALRESEVDEIMEAFDPKDEEEIKYNDFISFCKAKKMPRGYSKAKAKGRKKRASSSSDDDEDDVMEHPETKALQNIFKGFSTEDLIDVFEEFDTKQNGKITTSEFKQAMKDIGAGLDKRQVRALQKELDQDGSGSIELDEFLAFAKKKKPKKSGKGRKRLGATKRVAEALEEVSLDKLDKFIERKENSRTKMIATRDLKTILKAVKLNATKSDMEEVLEELEDDKGKISVDDFYKLTMTESSSKSNKKKRASDSEESDLEDDRRKSRRSRRSREDSDEESDTKGNKKSNRSSNNRFKKRASGRDLEKFADKIADSFKDMVRDGDMLDLEEVFERMDEIDAGHISERQFITAITKDLDMGISRTDLKSVLHEFMHADEDGQIDYDEFLAFCKKHGYKRPKPRGGRFGKSKSDRRASGRKLGKLGKASRGIKDIEDKLADQFKDAVSEGEARSIRSIFEMIDTKDLGYIKRSQFKDALSDMNVDLTREENDRLFDSFDVNDDGRIDIREFSRFCEKHGYKESSSRDSRSREKSANSRDDDAGSAVRKAKRAVKKMKAKGNENDIIDTIESNGGKDGVVSTKDFENSIKDLGFELSSRDVAHLSKKFASKENRREVDYDMFLEEMGIDSESSSSDMARDQDKVSKKVQEAFITCANGGYLDDVRSAFEEEDGSGSGFIPTARFRSVIRAELDAGLSDTEFKALCRKFEDREEKAVDYRQFLRTFSKATTGAVKGGTKEQKLLRKAQGDFVKSLGKTPDETEILEVFEAFDEDLEGAVKTRDFVVALKDLGLNRLSRDQVHALAKQFGNGEKDQVDYKAFLKAVSPHGREKGRQDMAQRLRRKIRARATLYSKEKGRHLDLRSEFKDYDTSGSGEISKSDFAQVANEQGWDLTNEEMKWLLHQFDHSSNGRIGYLDFCRFASLDKGDIKSIEKRLKKLIQAKNREGVKFSEQFEWFDTSGTGKIGPKDFKTAMGSLGFPLTDMDVELIIDRYDSDFDGKINYSEFLEAFAYDDEDRSSRREKTARGSRALTTQVPLKRKGKDAGKWSTGLFYDWTHGLGDAIQEAAAPAGHSHALVGLPVAGSGTVGEFLEKTASPQERRNFFELMFLLSTFEKRLGIQQAQRSSSTSGDIVIQLGTRLKCSMKFETE